MLVWSMFKIDVFVCKRREYDQTALTRIQSGTIGPDDEQLEVLLAAPEDILINKLEWYRDGGETSDRQWMDVLGVLKVQRESLDREYLAHWATELKLVDFLDRAIAEAGLD